MNRRLSCVAAWAIPIVLAGLLLACGASASEHGAGNTGSDDSVTYLPSLSASPASP